MKNWIFFLLLGSMVFTACPKPDSTPYLYKKTSKPPTFQDRPNNFMNAFAVEVDLPLLSNIEQPRLKLILPGKEVIGVRENLEQVDQGIVWVGKVEGDAGSSVIFTQYKGVVVGNIRLSDGSLFVLRFAGEGLSELQQLDATKFGEEAEPVRPQVPDGPQQPLGGPCPNTDPPDNIDVLVAYTATTRAAAGGTDPMIALIYLAVHETNLAYYNSSITQRLRLVHVEEVAYAETGDVVNLDLPRLQNPSDTYLDALHTSRDAYFADCVVLIEETLGVDNNGFPIAGRAYRMDPVGPGFHDWAFSVVMRNAATGYFSFAHELGHNMGADHNCENTSNTGTYPYDHGWRMAGWRTIMAYGSSFVRIPNFSNPYINYMGNPTGGATSVCLTPANNHQVLNNTAFTVANFRCHSSNTPDVWIKDTWNDTGTEPDPATASEDMWISPYIWVRNNQDINKIHQHQHENPIVSQNNWVYVKLHNGANTIQTGDLEVWIANASISLSWQSGWTRLSTVNISLPKSSTTVVEMPVWSPSNSGHYCLVARWVSTTDLMHVVEGPDINANTRNNNNIAWRNVNIDGRSGEEISFLFANKNRPSVIRFKCKDDYPFKSFAREGTVRIRFDKDIDLLVNQSPPDKNLAKRDGDGFLLTGNGDTVDFVIPSDQDIQGQVYLTFTPRPETPWINYIVDVSHLQRNNNNTLIPVGGIRYEIQDH